MGRSQVFIVAEILMQHCVGYSCAEVIIMGSVRRSFSFADNDCNGIPGLFSVIGGVVTAKEGSGDSGCGYGTDERGEIERYGGGITVPFSVVAVQTNEYNIKKILWILHWEIKRWYQILHS